MKKLLLFGLLFLIYPIDAQNFEFEHQLILLDSAYDQNEDLTIHYFIENYKQLLDENLNQTIGECKQTLASFSPQSPLSNLVTDLLLEFGNEYAAENNFKIDFSFMNFGGIRTQMPQGAISLRKMYEIFPFENTVSIVRISGKNLKKSLQRFSETNCLAGSGLEIIYRNNRFISATVGGKPIEDSKIYCFITNSYVASGGEKQLPQEVFEEVTETSYSVRDALIRQIQIRHNRGELIDSQIDERVIVEPVN